MSLEATAALVGHKTLAMTMIYARIADKTVADEYFAFIEKVEALDGLDPETTCPSTPPDHTHNCNQHHRHSSLSYLTPNEYGSACSHTRQL